MHGIILLWGFTGILGKLILLPAELIVWYRMLFATMGLLLFFPFFKTSLRLKHIKFLWQLIAVGTITCLHWIFFFKSISLSTASLAVLCLSTTTLHVAWLDPIIMKRKFSWLELFFGLAIVVGIFFISSDFNPTEYIALAYGLTAALFAALFAVSNAKLVQTIPSFQITFYEMLTGVVVLSLYFLFNENIKLVAFSITYSDFWWLIVLGIGCTSIPFVVMIDIVKRIGAFTTSLSINLEPIYTLLLAIVILQENTILGTDFYLGAILIIGIVVLNSIIVSKRKRKVYKNSVS